jgi:methionyl-tRNA formyltransferase
MTGRARTVFLGSGAFGAESLRRLARHPDVDLVGVVTAPARAAGRGGRLTPTPIDETAAGLGVSATLRPERLRAAEAVADVLALGPDLLVLADYGQIVPAALLAVPEGALNLHPSLLPRHRGAAPIPAAILAGDAETGVSLMVMDSGLDTGPIVAVDRVALAGDETSPDLEQRLATVAADLLERSLAGWMRGEVAATPQGAEGATLTRPLRRSDGRLDPSLPAVELERQVRAYQPWPASWLETPAGRLTVWRAGVAPSDGSPPGFLGPRGLSAADGLLAFEEVQLAGSRRMAWDALLRGRPNLVVSSG